MKSNTKPSVAALLLLILGLLCGGVTTAQDIDFGKSYINLSKPNGGTNETGDTLEIRAAFVVKVNAYDSCGFYDTIRPGTSYIPGTLRVLTNEGKIYKQFTDAVADDEAWISGGAVRINLGFSQANAPARWFRRGRVANTHRPSFYNSTCIMVASYRVRITAANAATINTGGGKMTYRLYNTSLPNSSKPLIEYIFVPNTISIYSNYGICSNSVGVNSLGTEFNGTFGSGKPRNRGTSANVPTSYSYTPFTNNSPQDYYYGIPNNTSIRTGYTTSNAWAIPNNTYRVFGVWDIIGDHTGAANPIAGNPPADTVANSNAGYMLVINASYRIDSAFQQTISNLCPNTYYEISCWVRNICSRCGCDSAGRGAGTAGYIPTAATDSSGVYPNLTFEVDGMDLYTTGNIRYSGQWVKKGFTFLTGPNQTSFTLKFFNNAPGGGGNDWALDDIQVATCGPNLQFTPSANPVICQGNVAELGCYVNSYFNNFNFFKWQVSTNGGSTWADQTAVQNSNPSYTGSSFEYFTALPQFQANAVDSGKKFRVVVATTSANLGSNCAFADATAVLTLNVTDCRMPLATEFFSFDAKGEGENNRINWTTGKEDAPTQFVIERSSNGIDFHTLVTLNGANNNKEINAYTYVDSWVTSQNWYYRIRLKSATGNRITKVVLVSRSGSVQHVLKVQNPVQDEIRAELMTVKGTALIQLLDGQGRIVHQKQIGVMDGSNKIRIGSIGKFAAGVYILKVQSGNTVLTERLLLN